MRGNQLYISDNDKVRPKKPIVNFLLLDLREEAEYEKFHINQGELTSDPLARVLFQPG